jgi:hypothetical protein
MSGILETIISSHTQLFIQRKLEDRENKYISILPSAFQVIILAAKYPSALKTAAGRPSKFLANWDLLKHGGWYNHNWHRQVARDGNSLASVVGRLGDLSSSEPWQGLGESSGSCV